MVDGNQPNDTVLKVEALDKDGKPLCPRNSWHPPSPGSEYRTYVLDNTIGKGVTPQL